MPLWGLVVLKGKRGFRSGHDQSFSAPHPYISKLEEGYGDMESTCLRDETQIVKRVVLSQSLSEIRDGFKEEGGAAHEVRDKRPECGEGTILSCFAFS